MSRLQVIDFDTATGKAKDLLAAVKNKLGLIPNMTKVMVNSPAVLEGYLSFSGALAGGLLTGKLREQLALVVAQQNHCNYCLSAHTAIGKMVGLKPAQLTESRKGYDEDVKTTGALEFAKRVLASRGQISEADIATVRAAGFSDGEVAEIIAHVALNVFTNYFNIATEVDIDFPAVSYSDVA